MYQIVRKHSLISKPTIFLISRISMKNLRGRAEYDASSNCGCRYRILQKIKKKTNVFYNIKSGIF